MARRRWRWPSKRHPRPDRGREGNARKVVLLLESIVVDEHFAVRPSEDVFQVDVQGEAVEVRGPDVVHLHVELREGRKALRAQGLPYGDEPSRRAIEDRVEQPP